MAAWIDAHWSPHESSGLVARDRRGGPFRTYLPDPLSSRSLVLPEPLARRAAEAETAIRRLSAHPHADGLAAISRFLLRSEAIASSMIEGIAPSAQQVALAELAQAEDVRGFSAHAGLVANNITVLRRASQDLVDADAVTVGDVVALHAALLPEERHHGLRTVQNWIGGSNWHPLAAEFVPPAPEHVEPLLADLVAYLNGATHGALVQAGMVHAQFETIHPFTDGNGRVGRALIHTVLTRRGLTPTAILPISLVLATLSDTYVGGLTAYRYVGDPSGPEAAGAVVAWLEVFVEAALVASEQAATIATAVRELRDDWAERLRAHRAEHSIRETVRAGSGVQRILDALPETPVMTANTAQRVFGVSATAAKAALDSLAAAGILTAKSVARGTTGYLARDVLDLVGLAERRLASTQFDTRIAPPRRAAPVRPGRGLPQAAT